MEIEGLLRKIEEDNKKIERMMEKNPPPSLKHEDDDFFKTLGELTMLLKIFFSKRKEEMIIDV